MRKTFFLILLFCISIQGFAQQVKQIHILKSQLIQGLGNGKAKIISPVFEHEGATLAADSANLDNNGNFFNAFGHVVITQTDGTVIYADLLNYFGNTRIAILTNNVRMVDKNGAVLTTDHLTYNMNTKVGTYTNGGKIVNGEDVLSSKNGYYFANSKDAYFRYNVVITSKDAVTKADTMRYNSDSKIAYFYGPTHIYGKKDTMYTEDGTYNTVTRQAFGVKNNLYQQGSKTLRGDTIFYDDIKGIGRAFRNITFNDAGSQKITLKGNFGRYLRADSSILVTKSPYVTLFTQDSAKVDTIYLTADTLFSKLIEKRAFKPVKRDENVDNDVEDDESELTADENTVVPVAKPRPAPVKLEPEPKTKPLSKRQAKKQKAQPTPDATAVSDTIANLAAVDSAKAPPAKLKPKTPAQIRDSLKTDSIRRDSIVLSQDTSKTRIVLAYHNVKIFKSDLQAKADSAFFSYKDSVIRCYKNPIVWSQGAQMTADTIYMQLKNQKLDNMLLQNKGFIVNVEADSLKYNQVKGKILTGFFKDNKLQRMYVNGNAQSLYYTSDSTGYTGLNKSLSSRMRVTFVNNELQDVLFIRKPTMVYNSIENVKKEDEILEGFVWKPKERPRSKEEIIPSLRKREVKAAAKPKAKTAVKKQ
ncbi:MAG: hypothetical protein K0S09_1142 [Sphingobacteriaceae bacterium]|nr:hypothetical protein [Sphingobacteriaceae bacterium]